MSEDCGGLGGCVAVSNNLRAVSGQRAVFYLYLRYRFKWDEKVYGYYVAYKTLGSATGMVENLKFHAHMY